MATKSEIERLAVLETEVGTIKEGVIRIETKLDNFDTSHPSRAEFDALKADLEAFKKQRLLTLILTSVATAIVTALVYYFVKARP